MHCIYHEQKGNLWPSKKFCNISIYSWTCWTPRIDWNNATGLWLLAVTAWPRGFLHVLIHNNCKCDLHFLTYNKTHANTESMHIRQKHSIMWPHCCHHEQNRFYTKCALNVHLATTLLLWLDYYYRYVIKYLITLGDKYNKVIFFASTLTQLLLHHALFAQTAVATQQCTLPL